MKHGNENKHMDIDALDIQEIRVGALILCFHNFYFVILAANITNCQSSEISSSYSKTFELKTKHNTIHAVS